MNMSPASRTIPKGYGVVTPRGQERALQVLAAAEALDVDVSEITTVAGGYQAPASVLDYIEKEDADAAAEAADAAEDDADTASETGDDGSTPEGQPAEGAEATSEAAPEGEGEASTGATVDPETSEVTEPEPAKVVEAEPAKEEAPAPKKNASGDDWAAWAQANKGYDPTEDLSRDELIQRFGA